MQRSQKMSMENEATAHIFLLGLISEKRETISVGKRKLEVSRVRGLNSQGEFEKVEFVVSIVQVFLILLISITSAAIYVANILEWSQFSNFLVVIPINHSAIIIIRYFINSLLQGDSPEISYKVYLILFHECLNGKLFVIMNLFYVYWLIECIRYWNHW